MNKLYSDNSLVSVVMPVKQGRYLKECVTSLCQQTFSRQEILLIDDGCEKKYLNDVIQIDDRIKIACNKGKGLVDALNTGLALVTGELIARMDADDVALATRFEKQIHLLNSMPQKTIVAGKVKIFRTEGEIDEGFKVYQQWLNSLLLPADIERDFFIESPLPHPTVMMPVSVIQDVGRYHDKEWPEDYDYWLRAREAGYQFAKPEDVLLNWRDESDRTSRNDPRYEKKAFIELKARYVRHLKQGRSLYVWGTGKTGIALFDALGAEQDHVKGFIDLHPRRVGKYKRGLPVYPIDDVPLLDGLILVAVSARGVREKIREFMHQHKKQETLDFWFFA